LDEWVEQYGVVLDVSEYRQELLKQFWILNKKNHALERGFLYELGLEVVTQTKH
jgi:hypothetical protein